MFFESTALPRRAGREAAEPGGGWRRDGVKRRRGDLVRRNSAVHNGKGTAAVLSLAGQALGFVESELPGEGVELLTTGTRGVRLELARP